MSGYERVLEREEYKDKKNLIAKFEAAFGNKEMFKIAIEKLSARHKRAFTAFRKYFGYNHEPMTLGAIGKEMNISHTRVSQLSKKAFRILIHPRHRKEIWEEHGYKPPSKNI
jgi:DNA-directed RNA polymerase sigma subunit (sigma70/sigma32)